MSSDCHGAKRGAGSPGRLGSAERVPSFPSNNLPLSTYDILHLMFFHVHIHIIRIHSIIMLNHAVSFNRINGCHQKDLRAKGLTWCMPMTG